MDHFLGNTINPVFFFFFFCIRQQIQIKQFLVTVERKVEQIKNNAHTTTECFKQNHILKIVESQDCGTSYPLS